MFATYWIGSGDSDLEFDKLLKYSIDDNGLGEFVASDFCKLIGINHYYPELFGGRFFPKKLEKLSMLFRGDPFLEKLKKENQYIPASNCIVSLVYKNEITEPKTFTTGSFSFYLLGSYESSETFPGFE